MPGKQDVLDLLERLEIPFDLMEHEAVMTVAESALIRRNFPGMLCKCLFLKDRDGYWLLAIPAALRVDLKKLAASLGGKRLSFASREELQALLGLSPGAVSLLGVVNDSGGKVRVLLDNAVACSESPLLFHPMVNTATVRLGANELIRFLEYVKHNPAILSVPDSEENDDA